MVCSVKIGEAKVATKVFVPGTVQVEGTVATQVALVVSTTCSSQRVQLNVAVTDVESSLQEQAGSPQSCPSAAGTPVRTTFVVTTP